mmetsp:Transcript_14917/g.29275  ORF Transcript_14917/g.29275 Transcript_14917/m.29275 type:complete len:501 (+) Transcript_14917:27-1529(+)|eukprot:CAMPEP_0175127586 /NCGR_PEP_ID=MMETSP0087-20121206/4464_1 /TAXON_ID=136419 /ORGANISM="Unknown Unknown, Strain D1" /LENGTH=500 /DNA_ID=CAMNT_0016409571 /DNA_START=29 /DNA_END=1531 /DNA_ORIENTATION=+
MGCGASSSGSSGPLTKKATAMQGKSEAIVLCGPIVGKVTDTTAVILLEVDEHAKMTCVAKSSDGKHVVKTAAFFPEREPRTFFLEGLKPDTKYIYEVRGELAKVQQEEVVRLPTQFKTMPAHQNLKKIKLVALSCDQPRRLFSHQENPWERLVKMCEGGGGFDVMLHLGDQVYTKMDGFLDRAMQKQKHYSKGSKKVKNKVTVEATEELREAYRYVWGLEATKKVLCQGSHLMVWSDNDVANDFTELDDKQGNQFYSSEFITSAMHVYTEYQRQLWDPACQGMLPKTVGEARMKEWHFHRYGGLGVFMVDMRGNRITPNGVKLTGTIMGEEQKQELKKAFATPGLSCMILASEIPFVSDSSANIQKSAKKIKFLEGHWAYEEKECTWLYDLCFDWKAAKPGREVVLIGGDIHTGLIHELTCSKTKSTIKSITASPITNHVCGYFPPLEGKYNQRYSFKAQHFKDMRNYAVIEASFDAKNNCKLDVKMELIPWGGPPKGDD